MLVLLSMAVFVICNILSMTPLLFCGNWDVLRAFTYKLIR